jgi:hypothetical protein
MKLSNYIAYDNRLMMIPNLYVKVIFVGVMPLFCTWIFTRKPNVGYNFAISQYFFMKLPNYIAQDNTLVMMRCCSGQDEVMPLFELAFFPTLYQRATQVFT